MAAGKSTPRRKSAPRRKSKAARRREMWARRIVSTLILLALLVALGFGAVKGIQWLLQLLRDSHQSTVVSAGEAPVETPDCTPETMDVNLSFDPQPAVFAGGTTMDVELVGSSAVGCIFRPDTLDITVSDGKDVIWSPTACTPDWGMPLLLTDQTPWQTSFSWDGHRFAECELGQSGGEQLVWAEPGTYDIGIEVAGKAVSDSQQLVVD